MTPQEAVREACERAGGQAALAKQIGVAQSAVSQWITKSRIGCGARYALPIEAATGVSRHDLRPDIYPREDAAA